MYVLAFKVRELLLLMFINLFVDWGNSSRLTPVMPLIDLGKPIREMLSENHNALRKDGPCKRSTLDLVTDVNFKLIL